MSDPIVIPRDDSAPEVSRANLRHLLTRRRNERIAELRDDRWPLVIYCHVDTRAELLVDNDPAERDAITDFEGAEFMNIRLVGVYTDDVDTVPPGEFVVVWPTDDPAVGAVLREPYVDPGDLVDVDPDA